jgi:glutathione S-transferase
VLELWQAEWCPHSRKVRMRLTELGVDFVARQVEARPRERRALREATGGISIPALRREDGTVLEGEDEILPWLDEAFAEGPQAEAHREQARRH